jgi:diguanylate cyclase (GGDEF)-like protein/PAS domain S-box-containing protein
LLQSENISYFLLELNCFNFISEGLVRFMKVINRLSEANQLRNLLKTSKPAIFIGLLLGLILIFSERHLPNAKLMLIWFVILFIVSLMRIRLITVYQRTAVTNVAITNIRLRNIRIYTFLSGIIWGSIGIVFFHSNDMNHLIFLTFILAGLTAGNTVSNASDLPSSIGFSIFALSPIMINLFLNETTMSVNMGVALLLYFGFLIVLGRHMNATIIQSTILQHKAEASEKEARISEERYRVILQYSPAGIVHYSKELVITYCNDRFAEVMKAPKEKLIGLDMKSLKDQRLIPLLREVFEGKEGSFEGEYTATLSNTQVWIVMSYVPLRDDNGTIEGGIAIIEDITAQKEYHNRLEKSEQTLLYLLKMSPIAVRIAKSEGSKVVFANEAYSHLIQEDISAVLGKNPKNYYANKEEYTALVTQIKNNEIVYDRLTELFIGNDTVWALASYMPIEFEGEACVLGWFYDITEEKQLQKQLEEQRDEFKTIFNTSKDGIAILDKESNFLDFNEAYLEMIGYTREELLKMSCISLSDPEDKERAMEAMKRIFEIAFIKDFEKTCIGKDGKKIYINMAGTLLPDKQRILISTKDISSMKEHARELERIAHYDALTGLPNRILESDRLRQGMIQTQRRGLQLAVLYLDLDGFKAVNDTYGHPIGDQLLIGISARMKQALREGDTLARLGGDEFVAILVDLDTGSSAIPIINRLLEAASLPIQLGDLTVQVSASIGVTFYPQEDEVDGDLLIRQADQAMYVAKQLGKNSYHLFDIKQDS